MKTVTDAFVDAQKSPAALGVRTVQYKRRLWDQVTRAFIWETDWSTLSSDRIVSLPPVVWQLDTDNLNEFKVSNTTLVVDNFDNYFRFDNPNGLFGQDSASPNYAYEPYWMKFRIRAGFQLADASDEVVTVFSGIATEYTMDSDQKNCQIIVQGLETLLLSKKAEGIATTVTEELNGTVGNAVIVDFTTLNPGVGGVTLVSLDGITQIEGEHYSTSQTDEPSLPAKVTFVNAPDVGVKIRISYFYWPQNLAFSDLVTELLTAGGIAGGNQLVEPVVFGNSVINTNQFTSQADWDSGSKTRINSTYAAGSIRIDWDDSSFRSLTTYSQSMTTWTETQQTGRWSSDGTSLKGRNPSGLSTEADIYGLSTKVTGSWEFKFTLTDVTAFGWYFAFMANDVNLTQGYSVSQDLAANQITLRGGVIGGGGGSSFSWVPDLVAHTVTITRTGSGRIRVFFDSVLKLDETDTTWTTSTYLGFRILNNPLFLANAHLVSIKDIYIPTATATATWISPVIDLTSTPTAFGTMTNSIIDAFSAITIQTATSSDGFTFDSYIDISSGHVPQSALKRYVQIKALFSIAQTVNGDPQIDSLSLISTLTATVVTIPSFTGLSVYEAIQAIGQFVNYEFGFTPDEVFFFRSKDSGASVLSLNQSNYISRMSGLVSGYDKVYGVVRVTYGTHMREISAASDNPADPTARVSERRYEVSPSDAIQIPASADVATGVARELLTEVSRPRRRVKVVTKFLPQIDLSDVVTVDLVNNTPDNLWYWGDGTLDWGDNDVNYWGDATQIVNGFQAKILGAKYDLGNFNCEFDLQEVLT